MDSTPRRLKPLCAGTPQVGKSPSTLLSDQAPPPRARELDVHISHNRTLIETQQQLFRLCHGAKIQSHEIDEHSSIFVQEEVLKELRVEHGDLVEIAAKPDALANARWRVVQVYAAKDYLVEGVAMSPLLWFNLKQTQGFKPAKESDGKVILQRVCMPQPKRLSVVQFADEFNIKLISAFTYPTVLKLTEALSRYFSKTRRVVLNDVIVVPRDCLDSGEYTMNLWAEAPVAYYKISKLLGPWIEGALADEITFKVDIHHSNLTQGAGCMTHRVPVRMEWFLSTSPPGPFWRHQPLPGLHTVHHQLLDAVTPYLQPMPTRLPATILLTGPPGCGKYSVVRSLAVLLGLQMIKVNCHDLCGDSAAATEARIRNLITKAQTCTPSILLIENFEALGREKDPTSYDVRIAAAFGDTIRKTRDKTDLPVILIATSAAAKINTEMSEVFLHEFTMQAPSEEERRDMLYGLLDDSVHSVDVCSLAKRTAGMVLSDMVTLIATARLRAHRRIVTDNYGDHVCPGWLEERGLCESDVTVTSQDVDAALQQLQTLHADALGAPKIPDVSWDDVGGLEDVKADILDTIQLPLQHPELFAADLRRSGVLLYGPPGCGKTLVAKAVAAECSLNFLSVKGPELINMYVGQSEENIREVFARARSAAPCVVFFDELDSLAPNRGRTGDSGGVMDRVVSQLLAELDGLHSRADVFIIGATNRPDLLDPALTRPGRFDKLLYVGVPEDKSLQVNVLKALTRKFDLCEDVDLSVVAERCPTTLTGADLYALCADASMSCIRRQVLAKENGTSSGSSRVTMDDFMRALSSLKPSVSEDEMIRYKMIQQKHKQR